MAIIGEREVDGLGVERTTIIISESGIGGVTEEKWAPETAQRYGTISPMSIYKPGSLLTVKVTRDSRGNIVNTNLLPDT